MLHYHNGTATPVKANWANNLKQILVKASILLTLSNWLFFCSKLWCDAWLYPSVVQETIQSILFVNFVSQVGCLLHKGKFTLLLHLWQPECLIFVILLHICMTLFCNHIIGQYLLCPYNIEKYKGDISKPKLNLKFYGYLNKNSRWFLVQSSWNFLKQWVANLVIFWQIDSPEALFQVVFCRQISF